MRHRYWIEAAFWTTGLAAVAIADPASGGLISSCLFDRIGEWAGLSFCPGCGLGHGVGYLVRGQFDLAFASHPLSPVAPLIIGWHVGTLIRKARITT